MNPELLGSFLSARPTGRQFGPARIAAVPIWFHWGVVASDPASAFEDVLSLDTILARKKKNHADSGKATAIPRLPIVGCWQIGRFGCFFISKELNFFFGCPDRCGLVIYKQDMKAGFLPTQPDSNPCGQKMILPKTGLWNPWRCFFWAQQGRLQAFNHPQKRLPKNQFGSNATGTLQEDCGSSQGHGWGFTITCPFFGKIQTSSLPKIVWETCSESIQFFAKSIQTFFNFGTFLAKRVISSTGFDIWFSGS